MNTTDPVDRFDPPGREPTANDVSRERIAVGYTRLVLDALSLDLPGRGKRWAVCAICGRLTAGKAGRTFCGADCRDSYAAGRRKPEDFS